MKRLKQLVAEKAATYDVWKGERFQWGGMELWTDARTDHNNELAAFEMPYHPDLAEVTITIRYYNFVDDVNEEDL